MSRTVDPSVAAVLSLLVPGVGHIYAGHVFWGVLWLVLTGGSWLFTAGCFALFFHAMASWHAFKLAAAQR